MAEVEKPVQKSTDAGVLVAELSGLSASDDYLIPNDGKTILEVVNDAAEATDVTIVTPGSEGGLEVEDRKVTVAAETKKVIGPFRKSLYNNAKEQMKIKLSKVTSVTVGVFSIGD